MLGYKIDGRYINIVEINRDKTYIYFQNGNETKTRGRKKKIQEEPPSKKKKYEHIRTCDGKSIPDDQPLLLSGGIMRDYQLQGYLWMATLYENGINGLLTNILGVV